MLKNPGFIIGLIVFVPLMLLANYFLPTSFTGYRMTIEVETPDGIVSGSGVVHVQRHDYTNRIRESSLFTEKRVIGEAIVIDTGKNGKIFALLVSEDGNQEYPEFIAQRVVAKKQKGEKVLLKTSSPLFVRFADPANPASIKKLNEEDLHLKSITVEKTDDAVSQGILEHLPWLATQALVSENANEELINIGWNQDFAYLPRSAFIQP